MIKKYLYGGMMDWRVLVRKWILLVVIFCLLGTISQACENQEEEEKCYEEKDEEEKVEEKDTSYEESDITNTKWFLILDRLIEKYPIIEKIIDWIFQWIFKNILNVNY
jgi:hypothetical protein